MYGTNFTASSRLNRAGFICQIWDDLREENEGWGMSNWTNVSLPGKHYEMSTESESMLSSDDIDTIIRDFWQLTKC